MSGEPDRERPKGRGRKRVLLLRTPAAPAACEAQLANLPSSGRYRYLAQQDAFVAFPALLGLRTLVTATVQPQGSGSLIEITAASRGLLMILAYAVSLPLLLGVAWFIWLMFQIADPSAIVGAALFVGFWALFFVTLPGRCAASSAYRLEHQLEDMLLSKPPQSR